MLCHGQNPLRTASALTALVHPCKALLDKVESGDVDGFILRVGASRGELDVSPLAAAAHKGRVQVTDLLCSSRVGNWV